MVELTQLLRKEFGNANIEVKLVESDKRFYISHSATLKKHHVTRFIQESFFRKFSHRFVKLETNYQLEKYLSIVVTQIDSSDVYAELDRGMNKVELLGKRDIVDKIEDLIAKFISPPVDKLKTNAQKRDLSTRDQISFSPKKPRLDESKGNERIKEIVSKISGLKWYQIRLIKKMNFLEALRSSFKSCRVELDNRLTEIIFKSTSNEDIVEAKSQTMAMLRTIVGAEIECENKENVLAEWRKNINFYIDLIDKQNICCVVDTITIPGTMLFYSTSHEQIKKCQNLILNGRNF